MSHYIKFDQKFRLVSYVTVRFHHTGNVLAVR